MMTFCQLFRVAFAFFMLLMGGVVLANNINDLLRFKNAYPEQITSVNEQELIWRDGTSMPVSDGFDNKTMQEKLDNPTLLDQIKDVFYVPGIPNDIATYRPDGDPGRVRYTPFFLKMYGASKADVEEKLTTIYWMPKFFGILYPLRVTTINHVNKKFIAISQELETLVAAHPEYLKFLKEPGGTFNWRYIANTERLSLHSFGMTIDINSNESNYWQYDLEKAGEIISEASALIYRNDVPWEIIPIFEKYGFIWGGKWHHYDSMHFEYRPELLSE